MRSAIHQALGDAFDILPSAVRAFHDNDGYLATSGTADATIAPGFLKHIICKVIGLPRSGKGQPVCVSFETSPAGIDRWRRDFGGRKYHSRLRAGSKPGELIENQFPFTNYFLLEATPAELRLKIAGFALLGIPMPRFLSPTCTASETDREGRLRFDIVIGMPFLGTLIAYSGELTPTPVPVSDAR